MRKKIIRELSDQEIKEKLTKLEQIQANQGNEKVELTINVTLVGRSAMFYRILEELIDVIGMDKQNLLTSLVEDGIIEMFKRLWVVFSMAFNKPFETKINDNETKN